MKKKYTYEVCYNEALKYTTQYEFRERSCYHYSAAYRNKWLDDYHWIKKTNHGYLQGEVIDFDKDIVDSVYVYLFEEQHSAYVGRVVMKGQKRRHYQHLRTCTDAVYLHMKEYGIDDSQMIILEDKLTVNEGREKEAFWIEYFREAGWNMLNRAQAGSIGGLSVLSPIWTYETCMEEAKKYKSRSEFNNNCGGAYNIARINHWLDDYVWFEIKWGKKWDEESCYNEAKKYQYKIDFMTKAIGAHEAACRNGWIGNYTWLKSANGTNQHKNTEKPIVQLTLDGKFVAEFNKCADCPSAYDYRYITQCCTHKDKSAYGYLWMYKKVYNEIQQGSSWEEAMKELKPQKKEVLQFDLNGNFIKEWSSTKEVCNVLHDKFSKRVAFCASHYGKTFKGYLWKWKHDATDEDYQIKVASDDTNKLLSSKCKVFEPVVQMDVNGNYINTFKTRKELQDATNRTVLKPIYNNCRGTSKIALGYKWMYLKDYEKIKD